MKHHNRDLLVLLKTDSYSEQALEKEMEGLHRVLIQVECNTVFCAAHELVTRTKITRKAKVILNAVATHRLKPFHFLINKN